MKCPHTRILALLLVAFSHALTAGEPAPLPLWPSGKLPKAEGAKAEEIVERSKTDRPDRSIRNVTVPTLTAYLPAPEKRTGAAIVICPGGGYGGLAFDKEGHEVARWLNSLGVAGLILKYRMPRPELSAAQKPWPLEDAARAVRLARQRSGEWQLDPKRIGIMGFSAGGHLASTLGTHWDKGQPDAPDPVERFSSRPDFMVLVYPVISLQETVGHSGSRRNLLGASPDAVLVEEYSNELRVNAETPPAFLVHAKDDPVKVQNSLLFKAALEQHKIPCDLALYEKGGHGYGLGLRGGDVATWPERCAAWLKAMKVL